MIVKFMFFFFILAATGNGQLTKIGDYCTCPNTIATYKCVVNGTGFTIWRGTAFDCPDFDNIIRLRHSEFSDGTMGLCNNGEIVGYSLRVGPDGTYTSQLNVSVNSNVFNKTIECAHQSSAMNITPIDSMTIAIPDRPSPPLNVHLVNATPRELEFSWSEVNSSCSTLKYIAESTCGACPTDLLTNTRTSCLIQKPDVVGSNCSFSVKSVVCGNIMGTPSNLLNVTLKVPQMPENGSVLPTYDNNTNSLIFLNITFFEVESFNISSGLDSKLTYTANYSDLDTGVVCDSYTISEPVTGPDCANNVCRVDLESPDIHSCSQSGSINVSISASNRLGNSPASYKIIGTTNQFVEVVDEQNGTIVCTFHNPSNLSIKQCDIAYGSCEQPLNTSVVRGITTSPNTVVISLPKPLAINDCYIITAANDTFSLQIQGMSSTNSNRNSQDVSLIVGLVVGIVIAAAIIIGLILIIVLLVYKCRRICRKEKTKPSTVLQLPLWFNPWRDI